MESDRPLSLRDASVRALLAFALAVELGSWLGLEGYPLADAIGYMDRARTLVMEGELNPATENLRSFVFPLLFAPLFLVARLVDTADMRWVVPLARVLQLAISTAFVLAAARLAARVFDRRTGLVAGVLVALNPFFLAHCVSPVSDLAAALCAAVGIERLLDRGDPRRVRAGGFWCGLGFLVSYKTLALYAVLGVLLVVRDRLRRPSRWGALAVGLATCSAVQVAIDRLVYGRWGHSIVNYLVDNVFGVAARVLIGLGQRATANRVYDAMASLRGYDPSPGVFAEVRQLEHPAYYLVELPRFLVWPVLLLTAVGVARVLRRRRAVELAALALAAGYLVLLSQKGSKSFRLALPVLPFVAAVAAWGWGGVLDAARARGPRAARAVAAAAAVLVLAFSWQGWRATGPRAYGAYWQAMDSLNRRVEVEPPPAGHRTRVASAHYFATFLRERPEIVPVRYRFAPWHWTEDESDPAARVVNAQIRRTFNEADWLLHSERLLRQRPMMLKAVQRNFTVEEAWYDEGAHSPRLGPVFVLKSRDVPGTEDGRNFLVLLRDADPAAVAREHGFGDPVLFRHVRADGDVEEVALLGWTWETLPGTGLGWITWYWHARTTFARDYQVRGRVVATGGGRGRVLAVLDHWPPYGADPRRTAGALGTSRWQPGWILCESYVVPHRLGLERAAPDAPDDATDAVVRVELIAYEDGERPVARLRPTAGETFTDEKGLGVLVEVGRLAATGE